MKPRDRDRQVWGEGRQERARLREHSTQLLEWQDVGCLDWLIQIYT